MYKRLLIIGLMIVMTFACRAQEELVSVNPKDVTVVASSGHNPTKALLLSLVPGAGQVYNGQAWKVPIFYAALGGVGYVTYNYYSQMQMFKKEYLSIGYNGTSTLTEYEGYPGSSIYNMYQSNYKNFQLFCIITAAVYGLNLLDAYVFGHLYDFNVSDDLAIRVTPSIVPELGTNAGFSPAINLSLTF